MVEYHLMWNQLKSELKNSKIYIYSVAITACILSVFGFVIFIASAGDQAVEALPSPSPTSFAAILGAKTGAQNNQTEQQPQQEQLPDLGPERPIIEPSPSPSPKVSPSPSLNPSPSPSPSLSPSLSPTPAPTNNSNPTPTTVPASPNKPETEAYCNDSKSKIRVTWNQPLNATGYKIYRNGSELAPTPVGTSYVDENVTGGTAYKYKVKALNSTGESSDSEEKEETAKSCS